jgi:hypothetical protein
MLLYHAVCRQFSTELVAEYAKVASKEVQQLCNAECLNHKGTQPLTATDELLLKW